MQFRSLALAIAAVVAVTYAPTTNAMELATNATAANSTVSTMAPANATKTTPTPSPSTKSGASTAAIAGGATLFATALAFTSA